MMKNLRGPLFAVFAFTMFALTTTPALHAADGIPAGAVMFFNLGACPAGWAVMPGAAGRYLVGLTPGGTLGHQVGSALRNREERTVAYHTHGVADPGHTHTVDHVQDTGGQPGGHKDYMRRSKYSNPTSLPTKTGTTGVTVQPAGEIRGTTAPYIQLLVCQKE